MKFFRRWAVFTTAATYFLIFMGGLVRVSGAGLGCPDWPKCFGRWIPPVNAGQLPADIDPALFNFTLAWIEYINRLIGVVVGLLIAATAVLAINNFRKVPRILIPSILAAVLVAFQGWQGGKVVASELEPIIVSVHMIIAFVIVSFLIYVSQQAYYIEYTDAEKNAVYPRGTGVISGILWILVIIQVVVGTQVRAAIEVVAERMPLMPESVWLDNVGTAAFLHTVLGIVVVLGACYIAYRIMRYSRRPSPVVRQVIWTMTGLTLIQILFGIVLFAAGIPAVIQVLHLWTASLITGFTLILFSAVRKKDEV
jgi:cytochrome c oxidase assembly protein subunit 15